MNNRFARRRWFVSSLLLCCILLILTGTLDAALTKPAPAPDSTDGKLRIICFGAHPDDNEFRAGGVAAMWAAKGHHVKFVNSTNGDIGHWGMAGGPLAQRRTAEVERCAQILGIETEVLDIHDGEIMVTLENRRTFVRLIREWRADIVMCNRPNDYHPDHRYSAILVQDAGYMVTVPFFCPDVPYLKRNPVFLFYQDRFQKPNPFTADIIVGIDTVIDKKMDAVVALASQTLEGGCNGNEHLYPEGDPTKRKAREREVRRRFGNRFASTANQFREELTDWYGRDRAGNIRYAEAFEICEYGRRPSKEEIRKLFPFFPSP